MQIKSTAFHRDLDKAERHFDRTARSMERRAQRFQRNMKKAWTGIAAGTAAVAAGLGAATSMSAKFEEQLVEVQKVTDPKTMRAMKEEIEDMANVMPLAHEGLTQIVADAGRMGIKGVESLTAFTKTVAKLSVATELTAERAAKDLGRITKWLNIPAKYAENLGAAINELSNNIPADADEIIRTLGKTGQQFEILGASTQTTLALSGAVAALADSAERGGTRMRRLIQQMQEPGTIADIAEAFGMTADAMERMIDNSPVRAIKMMAKAFKEGGTEADKLREALASTSEVTLTILANNLDMVNDALAMTGEQLENPTSLLKEFKAAANTTIAQLKMLWNTIKNVFMNALGDQANQILVEFIKNIRAWALEIEDLISNNKELRKAIFQVIKAILHIGGVITVIGLVGKAFFALMSPVTALIAVLMTLGALWRWNAWGMQEFIKSKLVKQLEDFADTIQSTYESIKKVPAKLGFSWKEPEEDDVEGDLKEKIEAVDITNIVGTAIATTIGILTWKASGSFLLAAITTKLTLDWGIKDLTKHLKEAIKNDWSGSSTLKVIEDVLDTASGAYLGWKITGGNMLGATAGALLGLAWDQFKPGKEGSTIKGLLNSKFDSDRDVKGPIEKALLGVTAGIITYAFTGSFLTATVAGKIIFDFADIAVKLAGGLEKIIEDKVAGAVGDIKIFGQAVFPAWREKLTDVRVGKMGKLLEIEGQLNEDQLDQLSKIVEKLNTSMAFLEENEKGMLESARKLLSSSKKARKTAEESEKTTEAKEKKLEDYKKAIREILDKYAGIETPWTQEAVNRLSTLITDLEEAKIELGPELKELVEGGKLQIELSGIEPEKKQHGGFAGTVPGTGSGDIIPAMLEPGEFVWPKEMVQKMPWIVDMWRGLKEGGAVSAGRIFYGPDAGGGEDFTSKFTNLLESWIETPSESPFKPENVELFKKDLGAVVTLFKEFSDASADFDKLMEYLEGEMEALKEDMKGLTKNTDIASMSLEDLNEKLKNIDISQIGQLPEALKRIMSTEYIKEIPKGLTKTTGGEAVSSITAKKPRKGEDWTIQALSTLKTFDDALGPLTEQLVSLEEIADKYGVSSEEIQDNIDGVRDKFIRLTGSSEAFDKALEEAREETTGALGKLANALGVSASKLKSWVNSTISSLSSLIQQTGVLTDAQSELLNGMASVTRDLVSGNWAQAIIDGLTAIFASWITKLKKKREELQKQLDATYSMINDSIRELGNQISNLAGGLIGPFDSALSGAIDGIVNFAKMIQQGGETAEGTQSAFSALLSITTGLLDSFVGLLQRSEAWQNLQKEMEPIWDALANALGVLIQPIRALVDWIKDYLGIAENVNDEMKEIADAGVAQGFKRQRAEWEAALPDQVPTVSEDGGGTAPIPQWAKDIIQPIKEALIPVLSDLSTISISQWAQNVWGGISEFTATLINTWWPKIQAGMDWLVKNAPGIWNTIKKKVKEIYGWFVDNFQSNFESALGNLKDWDPSDLTSEIEQIDATLGWLTGILVGAIGALAGAIIGAIAASHPLLSWAVLGAGIAGGILGSFAIRDFGSKKPELQAGGVVTGPTPALIGEAGPEAVIPLDRMDSMSQPQTVNVRLDIDGRELNSHLSKVDRRDEYTTYGSTRGRKGGYGRN